jgi:hypothetical protein
MWGSGGSGDGQFNLPHFVTTDVDGNVYVTDWGNHRAQEFDAGGTFQLSWGHSGTGDGEFNHPEGIAVTPDHIIYVVDGENHRVQKFQSQVSVEEAPWERTKPCFLLHQNYPNPFNPMTSIGFELQKESVVGLCIFDVQGRLIRTLANGNLPRDHHTYTWNGIDNSGHAVGSGVYCYRLRASDEVMSRYMMLVR